MAQVLSEDQLQAACFQWHWNTYPAERQMLFHVQQKAKNAIEGARFKAIGVVKGITDLILILPHKIVFIELKWEVGRVRPEQYVFKEKVIARGHVHVIVRTLEEFKKLIELYYA